MTRPISSQVTLEWTADEGPHNPQTARRSRGILPTFATKAFGGTSLAIVNTEPVTVTLTVPSLASGASTTVTQKQGFATMAAITPSTGDIGSILFCNISVGQVTGLLPGHPTIALAANGGNPTNGALQAGMATTGLGLAVTLPVYATAAFAGGTITVTATALLLGTSAGNQR